MGRAGVGVEVRWYGEKVYNLYMVILYLTMPQSSPYYTSPSSLKNLASIPLLLAYTVDQAPRRQCRPRLLSRQVVACMLAGTEGIYRDFPIGFGSQIRATGDDSLLCQPVI